MDKNTLVGFGLIALILISWSYFTAPSQEEIAAQQKLRDSLSQVQLIQDSLARIEKPDSIGDKVVSEIPPLDSALTAEQRDSLLLEREKQFDQEAFRIYGAFAPATKGTEKRVQLENDQLRITFSNKGGRIVDVWVKEYLRYKRKDGEFIKDTLHLLNNARNQFAYQLPVKGIGGNVSTEDLYFEPELQGNTLMMRAKIDSDRYIEQRYELGEGYVLDYDLKFVGLAEVLRGNTPDIVLNWDNYLNRLEKNASYEQSMTTVYFKEDESSPDYCSCTSDDEELLEEEPIKWVGHVQQFFNTSLIAQDRPFSKAFLKTEMVDLEEKPYLKYLSSEIRLPYDGSGNMEYDMKWYLGPNDYEKLVAMNVDLEEIIPFGWSIFGAINRYLFRPLFNFFAGFIPSYGVIILLLTLLVRLALYPLQYRMLLSGIKTSVLRPEIKALKEKYKDDQQRFSQEQMKLYQQTGVNPLGGCLPMVLQMPIWFALYRFFPASIDFRQESFLWADDLSTYDSILNLGFHIPIYGDHVSLFTLLWVISMLAYLIYNSRTMDMTAVSNPTMKYVQYLFPFIFFFVLNSWAAGLTAYMFFSNLFNIAQTVITKQFVISEDKVRAGIEEKRKNPKKSKFQQRLDKMMQQQKDSKGKKK